MKTSRLIFILLGLIIFIAKTTFVSNAQSSNIKLLKRVPENAICVISYDNDYLLSKVDINTLKELPMVQLAFSEMKRELRADSSILINLWNDPNNYGINFAQGYVSYINITDIELNTPTSSFTILIPLSSKKKFESLLKGLAKEHYKENVEKRKKYKALQKRSLGIGWNKNTLAITTGNITGLDLESIMDSTFLYYHKKSVLNNSKLKSVLTQKNDMTAWVNLDSYMSIFDKLLNQELKEDSLQLSILNKLNDQIKEYDVTGNHGILNFEKSTINFSYNLEINDSLNDLLKKFRASPHIDKIDKYLSHKDIYAVAGINIDLKNASQALIDEFNPLANSIYELINESPETQHYDDAEAVQIDDATDPVVTEYVEENKDTNDIAVNESVENSDTNNLEKMKQLDFSNKDIRDSVLNVLQLEKDDLTNLFTGEAYLCYTGNDTRVDTFTTYDYIENEDGEFVYDQVEKTELEQIPLFNLYVFTNARSKFDRLFEVFDSLGILSNEGSYYYNNIGQDYIYMKTAPEGLLLLSNDKDFIEYTNNPRASKQQRPALITTEPGTSSFVKIDVPALIEQISTEDEKSIRVLNILSKNIDTFEFNNFHNEAQKQSEFNCSVKFNHPDQNGLTSLAFMINELFESFK